MLSPGFSVTTASELRPGRGGAPINAQTGQESSVRLAGSGAPHSAHFRMVGIGGSGWTVSFHQLQTENERKVAETLRLTWAPSRYQANQIAQFFVNLNRVAHSRIYPLA